MTISEMLDAICKEIVLKGEGRWESANEVLIGLNIWDDEDLIIFALRFLLANIDEAIIEPFDEEE